MRLEPGKVISDRYEVGEQLGAGGMAIVYRALDLKLDRSVTLKVMREDLEEGFIERFYKEAQSVASLSHANIVKVYDYGEDDGIHYIVMEYVDGTTLKDLIIKKAPFDEDSTLGVAVQIASGLLHAHRNEVIHRDIKPQNILVTHDGSVKIADFGIARAAKATTLTSNANSMGSVHYFSPEQARGGFVDHKSDIYALGITLFEMATGKLPYDGDAAVAVALKHINDPFPDPKEINPEMSDHLHHIICKATEKSSTKRYAAIEDMYRDMKRTINKVDLLEPINFEDSPTSRISTQDLESIRQHRRDYTEQLRQAYEEPDQEDEQTNRKVIFAAISTAAVLVILITVASVFLYTNIRPRPVNPPEVVGMTLAEAEALAAPFDLIVALIGEDFSEDYAAGLIMQQIVGPDDTLRRGDPLHVVISLGSAYLPMPNLIHHERDDAARHLADLQLQVEMVDYADADFPENIIMRTDPAAGEIVSRYQVVTLYVNLGPANSPFPMPNLRGMDEVIIHGDGTEISIVEFIQSEMRLIVGNIERQPNVMFPPGTVSWQSVSPGESVLPGDIIDITISTGSIVPAPTPTPTPDPNENQEPVVPEVPTTTTPNATTPDTTVPDAPQPASTTLSIELWDVPSDAETVHMRIYQRVDGGPMEMIVNYHIPVYRFPLPFPVTGTGWVQYHIFSVQEGGTEVPRAMENINFSDLQ